MKRFEIYVADLPYGLGTGTYVIILGNGIVDNTIFCTPVTFGKKDNDKNITHIQANTKNGRVCTIIAGNMRNINIDRINGMVDELAEEDCQHVKDEFSELLNTVRV